MKGCDIYQDHLQNMTEAEAERAREAARVVEAHHNSTIGAVQPPAQQPHQGILNNPQLLALYNAIPHDGQPELLAEMERGDGIEDLQAIVIRWMMMATTDAHVKA